MKQEIKYDKEKFYNSGPSKRSIENRNNKLRGRKSNEYEKQIQEEIYVALLIERKQDIEDSMIGLQQ